MSYINNDNQHNIEKKISGLPVEENTTNGYLKINENIVNYEFLCIIVYCISISITNMTEK